MNNSSLTIHVPNNSIMALYMFEMEGQISDGKYENSHPYNHWHWLNDVDNIVKDSKCGISSEGRNRRIWVSNKYNINEWVTYINGWRKGNEKYKNYGWATRVIGYAKFGMIYPELSYEEMNNMRNISVLLELLQMLVEKEENNPEKIFNLLTDFSNYPWREEYYNKYKNYITFDFVKKYLEIEYTTKDLKNDLKTLALCVNTIL